MVVHILRQNSCVFPSGGLFALVGAPQYYSNAGGACPFSDSFSHRWPTSACGWHLMHRYISNGAFQCLE